MPADRVDASGRRSVVPQAAGRSLWLAAAWTGAGTALIAAVIGIAAVAVCWLPASGPDADAGSALRAGVLTFLAALHGGITIDGVATGFVPLSMTGLVGLLAWRAGTGLADAAEDLGEQPPGRLVRAAVVQAGAFAATCGLAARVSALGTSHVPVPGAVLAGLVLFAVTGTVAFARWTALPARLGAPVPGWLAQGARAAAAGVLVYVAAGALLVAGSLLVHRERVELLSQQVGGGWSGIPVLLLGVLAAPNAAIAGASYAAGPGFALGTGSGVSLGSTVHGMLPAFPVLGAVPTGPATAPVWVLVALTPLAAGWALVRVARDAESWRARWLHAGLGVVGAGLLGFALAWQGGGAIGSGRLSVIGASPWQFGLALAAGLAVVAAPSLAAFAALAWWRGRRSSPAARAALAAVSSAVDGRAEEEQRSEDQLAG